MTFRTWAALCCVLGVGLLVRLLFAAVSPVFLEGDSQSYLLPAWELLHGQGFNPELRRAPLYPLFVAASLWAFGEELDSIALAQHVIGLGTIALTFMIGLRLFGPAAGVLASLAIALSGTQLIYERYVMTEALFGFLLVVATFAMLASLRPGVYNAMRDAAGGIDPLGAHFKCAKRPHPDPLPRGEGMRLLSAAPLLAGLAIGLAALSRPVAQAILPTFLIALLLALPRWRAVLQAAALAVTGYAVVVAPWAIRNLSNHDMPSAAGGLGRSLIARTVKYDTLFEWKWLSETYGGGDDIAARERMLLYRKRGNIPDSRSVRPYQDALIDELGLSQGQAERAMREVALEAIARRPLDYIRGSFAFAGRLTVGQHEPLQSHWRQRATKDWGEQWDDRLDFLATPLSSEQARPQPLAAALAELYQPSRFAWLLLPLVIAGCLFLARDPGRRPALILLTVPVLIILLSAFLDGPVTRYRYPLDPLLAVLAAGGSLGAYRAARGVLLERSGSPMRRSMRPPSRVTSPTGRELS